MSLLFRAWLVGALLAPCGCAGLPLVHDELEGGFQRGVALGFVDPSDDSARDGALAAALRETRALGATDVSILVPLYTESIEGTTVRWGALDDARGGDGSVDGAAPRVDGPVVADEAGLARAIRAAVSGGQRVLVFPIVRLRVRRPGEWRGKLRPPDRDAWFEAYARAIEGIAAICERAGAARLAIGSEQVSFEDDVDRWRALAARVRAVFRGRLLYSANWDRFDELGFWDALDEVGVSAYFTLGERGDDPSEAEIVARWRPIVARLAAFSRRVSRPVVFTEVGFPSVSGAAFWPWNDHQSKLVCAAGEGCERPQSLEAQRRLWAAFVRVFSARAETRFLVGSYAWLWAGAGGLRDRGYTPRGKPAGAVLKLWYARPVAPPSPR